MTDKSAKQWQARIEASREARKKLVDGSWKTNVAYRLGKPFATESDEERVAVTWDWSATKTKIASLFSQLPTVHLVPKHPRFAPAVPVFATELNDLLTHQVNIAAAMEESLSDVVNASGIAAVKTGYRATFEDVEVPAVDISMLPPEQAQMLLQSKQIPMTTVKRPVSERFYVTRISPGNLIWDAAFRGSDWDEASYVGSDGSMTWAQALRELGKTDERPNGLTPEDKRKVTSKDARETLSDDTDTVDLVDSRVTVTEIFYKASDFDAKELYFDKIRRIVFVEGLDTPVVDEDLEWQRFDEESNTYVGVCKFPIRILTLTYISDEAIPPSDSEVGRPQVNETMRSRSQIIQQRQHSKPFRWANTQRVDPMVLELINKGQWQDIVPVNGDGSAMLGEVARAHYPAEDWQFDRVTRTDLQEAWKIGPNQMAQPNSGERSASEANIVQQNFASQIGVERAKVAKFFIGIVENIAGLMQLYYDKPNELPLVGEENVARLEKSWDRSKINGKFVFTIRPDSTVLLDSSDRLKRLQHFLNLAGKSGYVNVQPIIEEMAALSGLDPALVMTKPQPKGPEDPNISLRLSGMEDLLNPIAIAMLMKSGQAPSADEIKAAKLLLQDAIAPLMPPPEVTSGPVPQGQLPSGPQPQKVNPDWGPMERVTKRVDEVGG